MCGLIIHLQNADDTGQFVGDIDELRLYGRAVSEEEVRALYAEHEGIVLKQQIQGIKEELSGLVSRAEAVYAQEGADGTAAQTYWIDDVPGGALEGYVNGGTASFTRQYVVAQDDWNVSASYSDGSQKWYKVDRDGRSEHCRRRGSGIYS